MNERIKELLKQAAKLANTEYNKDFDRNFDMIVAEKFAELIVKECANAIVNDNRLSDVRTARNGCVRAIKEHFGVEE